MTWKLKNGDVFYRSIIVIQLVNKVQAARQRSLRPLCPILQLLLFLALWIATDIRLRWICSPWVDPAYFYEIVDESWVVFCAFTFFMELFQSCSVYRGELSGFVSEEASLFSFLKLFTEPQLNSSRLQ
tara:strand:- start:110 stop:493 length:384 start_codon:yes stop_codon:yes gene_type:complete